MMPLQVHWLIPYLSTTDNNLTKRQFDWKCYNLVRCIKGEPFKGWFELTASGGSRKRFDVENAPSATAIVARAAASEIKSLMPDGGTLVPVPNSSAVIGSAGDYKSLRLAQMVVGHLTNFTVVDSLRWRTELPKAHGGSGTRNRFIIRDSLSIVRKPRSPVLLLDDVMTTGGHLAACAMVLEAAGHTVDRAFVLGRTVWEYPDENFARRDEMLP